MKRNKITFGAIGEGTARRFRQLFTEPLNKREYLKRNKLKILYVEREATGQRWVEEFTEKIRSSFVAVMEGKENSVSLVRSIKVHSSRVLSFRIYKRKNLIDRAASLTLANKISLITKGQLSAKTVGYRKAKTPSV